MLSLRFARSGNVPVRRHYGIAFRGTYPDSGSGSEISRLLMLFVTQKHGVTHAFRLSFRVRTRTASVVRRASSSSAPRSHRIAKPNQIQIRIKPVSIKAEKKASKKNQCPSLPSRPSFPFSSFGTSERNKCSSENNTHTVRALPDLRRVGLCARAHTRKNASSLTADLSDVLSFLAYLAGEPRQPVLTPASTLTLRLAGPT